MTHRLILFSRRISLTATLASAAVVIAVPVALLLVLSGGAAGKTSAFGVVSNEGAVLGEALAPVDQARIANMHTNAAQTNDPNLSGGQLTGQVTEMGVIGGRAFYRFGSGGGVDCFTVGDASSTAPRFGTIECSPDFPTVSDPLLDFSVFQWATGGPHYVLRAEGIAADGVAKVGFLDASGDMVASTKVENNMYVFQGLPPNLAPSSLAAYDAVGIKIYSRPVGG